MQIEDLLLPREKYAEALNDLGPGVHTFEVERSGKTLFYFAANHSHDPNNEQYPILIKYWQEFLAKTEGKDRIVLNEGGLRKLDNDERSAIINGHEGNFITLLAHKESVPVASPDLDDKEVIKYLSQFNKIDILLYWFVAWTTIYQKYPDPKPDFDEWIQSRLMRYKEAVGREGVGSTIGVLKQRYEQLIGQKFDPAANLRQLINPNRTGTVLNEIAEAKGDLREVHIVSEIHRHWEEGRSIFAVFGLGHLIIQRPALEKLLI